MSKMAPALQNHCAIKRLSFRRNNQAIVFAPCIPVRVPPVEFKRLKLQLIQGKKQVLAPLIAITAFLPAVIDEEIIENRRAKRSIFVSESRASNSNVSAC